MRISDWSSDVCSSDLVGVAAVLEVAILRPLFHRRQRTHAAVALVAAALVELGLAWRFLGAGDPPADQHRRRARHPCLADVARQTDDDRRANAERAHPHSDHYETAERTVPPHKPPPSN